MRRENNKTFYVILLSVLINVQHKAPMSLADGNDNNDADICWGTEWDCKEAANKRRYDPQSDQRESRPVNATRHPKYAKLTDRDALLDQLSSVQNLNVSCPLMPRAEVVEALKNTIAQISKIIGELKTNEEGCISVKPQLDSARGAAYSNLKGMLDEKLVEDEKGEPTAQALEAQEKKDREARAKLQTEGITDFIKLAGNYAESSSCLGRLPNKAELQQLVGHALSYTGLLIGDYKGLLLSFGGQFLARYDFFPSATKKALQAIQSSEQRKGYSAFLCNYRNMAKDSCKLAQGFENTVIEGIDYSFGSGKTEAIKNRHNDFMALNPRLIREATLFARILESKNSPIASRDEAHLLCESINFTEKDEEAVQKTGQLFSTIGDTPQFQVPQNLAKAFSEANQAYLGLMGLCHSETGTVRTSLEFNASTVKKNIDTIYEFAALVRLQKSDSLFKQLIGVAQDYQYYGTIREKLRTIVDPRTSNFSRADFFELTREIGKRVGRESLKELIEFASKGVKREEEGLNRGGGIQNNYARLILDICNTASPEKVCLVPGEPNQDAFIKQWKSSCFGPKSDACKSLGSVKGTLFQTREEKRYLEDYQHLCRQ